MADQNKKQSINSNENKMDSKQYLIADACKEQIINAAIDLLKEYGYINTSLSKIAKQAVVSTGLLSYHFSDKDDLMVSTLAFLVQEEKMFIYQKVEEKQTYMNQLIKIKNGLSMYCGKEKLKMFKFIKRTQHRRLLNKVKEGDGHNLKPYRLWNIFTHSLFHITIINEKNGEVNYALKSKYFVGEPRVDLYNNGKHVAYSKLPAAFKLENGILEVRSGGSGINRIKYISNQEENFSVKPDKKSIRGMRLELHKHFPKVSGFISLVSILVIFVSFILSMPQILESLTQIPWIAENIGIFESPIHFSVAMNISIGIAVAIAASERAMMLRNHWLIDRMG
ncbi:TetR/AcrR family transcriptional regulator [Mammaliicoccus sp. M-M45]|uniref:TetR/AcrR family transcriptional regulator n=1 Tax=Mammaliicoccus sp. M-M45 TaxID=2898704 RepID=UPI001EFB7237|nr:TetR/AcrR family transcriptional regulator [Mammaliicoccus sp. M-M45]